MVFRRPSISPILIQVHAPRKHPKLYAATDIPVASIRITFFSPRSGVKEERALNSRSVGPFRRGQAKAVFCLRSTIDLRERPHLVLCQ